MHQTTQNLDFNCSFSKTTELNIAKPLGYRIRIIIFFAYVVNIVC